MKYGGNEKETYINFILKYKITDVLNILKDILSKEDFNNLNITKNEELKLKLESLEESKLNILYQSLPLYKVKNLNTLNPTYYSKDLENVNKLVDYVNIKTIINNMKKDVEGVKLSEDYIKSYIPYNLYNSNLFFNMLNMKGGSQKLLPHIVSVGYFNKLENLYK